MRAGTGVVVRPAVAADAAAIASLMRGAFAALGVSPPPSALGETAETVVRTLEASGGAVAEAGAEIIGAVLWVVRDGALDLNRLAVAEGWRRRGIAKALLGAGERAARHQGIERLTLGTPLRLPATAGCSPRSVSTRRNGTAMPVSPKIPGSRWRASSIDPPRSPGVVPAWVWR